MAKLAPSLKRLFLELNDRWPHRDHRTDGWYANPKVRISKGHNPGHNGYSHAIDVDKDGINPMWIISNITKRDGILWYIIWNRHLYSDTYNWKVKPYHGSNPHTDHMHIEIRQTSFAEQWQGWWGIQAIPGAGEVPPIPSTTTSPGGTFSGDFGPNYGGRDYRASIVNLASEFTASGIKAAGAYVSAKYLRS